MNKELKDIIEVLKNNFDLPCVDFWKADNLPKWCKDEYPCPNANKCWELWLEKELEKCKNK